METGIRLAVCASAIALGAWFITPVKAQTDEIFDFIPSGGRTLLMESIAAGTSADELTKLLAEKHSRDEWLDYLKSHADAFKGVTDLGEHQLLTLADYLSFNMPLPADRIPADLASAAWDTILPRDGRGLVLTYCQSCHIITVVITQDRTKEAWLGTMNKPSHVEIDTTEAERAALASYLVINAGIPIDLVPEDLRAGGASY
jgi:mono/diheme cytochrome c family protein